MLSFPLENVARKCKELDSIQCLRRRLHKDLKALQAVYLTKEPTEVVESRDNVMAYKLIIVNSTDESAHLKAKINTALMLL